MWFPWKQEHNILITTNFRGVKSARCKLPEQVIAITFLELTKKKRFCILSDNNKKIFISGNRRKYLLQTKLKSQVLITDNDCPKKGPNHFKTLSHKKPCPILFKFFKFNKSVISERIWEKFVDRNKINIPNHGLNMLISCCLQKSKED